MIIETFGPPGAGKTTFSRALAQRLRDRGYTVDFVFEIPRPQSTFLNLGGFIPALLRVTHAIIVTITALCRPIANARGLRLARDLLRLMPPNNPVWGVRLGQYIIRLACVRSESHNPNHIVLFDQGFVQAVISLAQFSKADEKTIARAISMRTQSDLLIRFDAPKELLEQRLYQRVRQATFAERLIEPDVDTFLRAKPITDYVGTLLAREDQRIICVSSLDPNLMQRALDLVEEEISIRLAINGAARSLPDPEHSRLVSCARELALDPSAAESVRISAVRSDPELGRRLANASLSSFVIYVGGAGLTCLAQLVIARKIGAPSYGVYSYVVAWTTLLSYMAALGFNTVLLRFLAAYCATEQWSLARGIIRYAFGRSLLVAMVIALGGAVAEFSLADGFPDEMAIGLATVPLVALAVLGSAAVRALGGVISAIAPERLVRDGLMIALVVFAGMLSATPVNAKTALIALMVSSAATAGILGLSLRNLWPPQLRSAVPAYATGDWWHLALPVMTMIGVEVLMSRAGVILLGWIGDTRSAGIFALGLNIALLLVLPRLAVGTFFSPAVSRLHAQQNEAALQSLFARATVLSLVGTLALALPLLFLTGPLLRLFGEDFAATAPIAQILVVGQIVAAATGPQLNLLTMTGHERVAAAILVAGAIINIVACAIGIAFFGAIGAAIATAATNVVWNAAMAIYIYKRANMIAGLLFAFVEFRRPAAR
jgi:O-antigen/teichoic acid export membrane protein/predicted kinase